jgi:hypothetical protein
MKKIIVLLIATFAISAQGFAYGVKAGLNNGKNSSVSNAANGFTAGALFNLDAALVNVDIEALYTNINPENGKMSYLHIPATARFNVLPMIFVRGGVQYEHVLVMESSNGTDLIDNTNNGLSIIIGAGASLDLPAIPGLIVDVRYSIPMYNLVDKDISKGIIEDVTINNLQLTVGIMF